MQGREACPECGLTFKDGKRTFRTFGRPVVTLEQHIASHAKAQQLEQAAREYNSRAEPHQPTEELCDARCREAEANGCIRLPVLAPSRTTNTPQGKGFTQLVDLPVPTRDALIRHGELYGPEGVQEVADHSGIDLDVSPLAEYRTERGALEKRYRDSPTLQARLKRLSRERLKGVKPELVSELLAGTVTVPELAAEFNVQERTIRGWCKA